MWIVYSFASAIFAGATTILSKMGIKNINSNLATAIRTTVVLIFAWLMVFIGDSQNQIANISTKTMIFLILSGLATGTSWLCYFKALQLGNVNKVTPIDKSSTILTMILAIIFLGEGINILKSVCIILIGIGTYMMIEKKDIVVGVKKDKNSWFIWAVLSAIFASLTAILGKIGIEGVESNLGTAIRTLVVLVMAWSIVFGKNTQKDISKIDKKSWAFLILSGIATGASWLCYYKALQDGLASIVVPIDKLSILVTIGFSYIFLKEKLNKKSLIGLILIVIGTLLLLIK